MGENRTWIFIVIFALMCLQMLLSVIQVRRYQRTLKGVLGTGLLGIGQRKGGLRAGEILILSYNRQEGRVIHCKSMSGLTILAKFKDIPEYIGLTLPEIRVIGEELDAVEMKRYRKRHPYDPNVLSKKKGALIQAVEAIELRIFNESDDEPERIQSTALEA